MADIDADIDLGQLMMDSGLYPTQSRVYSESLTKYAQAMRDGTWNWDLTKNDPLNRMMKDADGNIMAGHHRFIAAAMAGIKIPEDVVITVTRATTRIPRDWNTISIEPKRR